jgi:PAS domain S-box-containing protein
VHPDDLPRLDAMVRRTLANRESGLVLEFRILRDGEVKWIESRILISYDNTGKPLRRIGVQIDVTESKLAEQALAERNAQFELARRAARVGEYTYDILTGTMRFSRSSRATFGLSDSSMQLPVEQWHARVHRDDMQRLRAEHIRAFKERRPEMVNEFRVVRPGGEVMWIEARSLVTYDNAGRAERLTGIYIDVTERRKTEDHKSLLIAELDHRVKNVLACVSAIAERSRECTRSADEFIDVLNDRIKSLANTHALLSRSRWQGVSLSELVHAELAFCGKNESVSIKGAEIVIVAEATQPVAMVLHELATNAAKYGALSNDHGCVSVRWRLKRGPSRGKLVLEWKEIGGRRVAAPNASGYGTSVIQDLIPYELGGAVHYVFAPDGVRCTLEIPARWVSNKA